MTQNKARLSTGGYRPFATPAYRAGRSYWPPRWCPRQNWWWLRRCILCYVGSCCSDIQYGYELLKKVLFKTTIQLFWVLCVVFWKDVFCKQLYRICFFSFSSYHCLLCKGFSDINEHKLLDRVFILKN